MAEDKVNISNTSHTFRENNSIKSNTAGAKEFITGIIAAAAGVLCFAPGALFIKMADGITPLEITLHRMAVASLLIFIFSTASGKTITVNNKKEYAELAFFGLIAAIHFGCFVASLSFTFVSHALSLCYTAPIFAALFSGYTLQEKSSPRQIIAILITSIGIFILVGFENAINKKILFGDMLALISGIALGLYQTLSRMYKDRYTLLQYKANAYFFAAFYLFLTLITLRFTTPEGFGSVYTPKAAVGVISSAVFCTLIGHALINYALRRAGTVLVSLITTQEVTGGIIFAIIFLNEKLSAAAAAGISISLAGIAIIITGRAKK